MTTFGLTSTGNNVIKEGSFDAIAKGKYDLHAWCEDEAGNILYDPWFSEYDTIVLRHNCIDENFSMAEFLVERNGRIYKKRPDWQPILKAVLKRAVSLMMADGLNISEAAWRVTPEYEHCFYNAYFWKLRNPDKGAKVCVGQMGWKIATGGEHWHFG